MALAREPKKWKEIQVHIIMVGCADGREIGDLYREEAAAAEHYKPRKLVVMGEDRVQTEAMITRLKNDPYYQAVMKVLEHKGIHLEQLKISNGGKAVSLK